MMATTLEDVQITPAALEPLTRAWAFKPYRWSVPSGAPELDALVLHRLAELTGRAANHACAISRGGDLAALVVLQPLEWDSRVLGMPAARLEMVAAGDYVERAGALDRLVDAALARARNLGLRHISTRIDAEDDAAIHVVEQRGFLCVDALTTFGAAAAAIARPERANNGIELRAATDEDSPAVAEIAAASFTDGRFHSDPSIPREVAAAVYREWSTNCCTRRAADETIVVTDGGRVAGFVALRIAPDTVTHLKRPTGTIVLIATAEWARTRGFGALLVSAAGEWFRARGVTALDVGTQLRNIRAARLYERCGYRLVASALSFRTMLQP